jgi:hypothetical protein
MLGGLGNITGMLKQAKEMKSRMETLQAELAAMRIDAESGGGSVRAVVDGRGTLVDIKIQLEALADVELLEDLIKAAIGSAARKAQQQFQTEMNKLTGGMNLPGLSDMLGGAGA